MSESRKPTDQQAIASSELQQFAERVAEIATSISRSVLLFVVLVSVAVGYLCWRLFSVDASAATGLNWWAIVLAALICTPAFIWWVLYFCLNQLIGLPDTVKRIARESIGDSFTQVRSSFGENSNRFGLFKSLRALFQLFRSRGDFIELLLSIRGVAIIANPLFLVLVVVATMLNIGLMFLSLLLLIF